MCFIHCGGAVTGLKQTFQYDILNTLQYKTFEMTGDKMVVTLSCRVNKDDTEWSFCGRDKGAKCL